MHSDASLSWRITPLIVTPLRCPLRFHESARSPHPGKIDSLYDAINEDRAKNDKRDLYQSLYHALSLS